MKLLCYETKYIMLPDDTDCFYGNAITGRIMPESAYVPVKDPIILKAANIVCFQLTLFINRVFLPIEKKT